MGLINLSASLWLELAQGLVHKIIFTMRLLKPLILMALALTAYNHL